MDGGFDQGTDPIRGKISLESYIRAIAEEHADEERAATS